MLVIASLVVLNPVVTILIIACIAYMYAGKYNKTEFGISLLVFGVSVFGYIGLKVGVPLLGKLSGLAGLYFVKESLPHLRVHISLAFTLLISFFICLVFYYLGPQTPVAFEKLGDVVYYSIVYAVLFNAIFYYGERVNYVSFSRISICYIIAYISFAVKYDLAGFENVVRGLSGLRTAVDQWNIENIIYDKDGFGDTVSGVSYQLVGNFTALSLVFLLAYIFSSKQPNGLFAKLKYLIFLHFALILLSGARQSIVLILISTASLFLCGNRVDRRLLGKFSLSTVAVIMLVVFVGVLTEVRSITNMFEAEGGIASVINRQVNIDAAYELIEERPWFGFGFGGYFIPEYGFESGEFRYFPHNVILELLSELGVVGTIFFLLTWLTHYIFNYLKYKVGLLSSEIYPGFFALPIFAFYCTSALMNEILVKSIAFFILVSFMLFKRGFRV